MHFLFQVTSTGFNQHKTIHCTKVPLVLVMRLNARLLPMAVPNEHDVTNHMTWHPQRNRRKREAPAQVVHTTRSTAQVRHLSLSPDHCRIRISLFCKISSPQRRIWDKTEVIWCRYDTVRLAEEDHSCAFGIGRAWRCPRATTRCPSARPTTVPWRRSHISSGLRLSTAIAHLSFMATSSSHGRKHWSAAADSLAKSRSSRQLVIRCVWPAAMGLEEFSRVILDFGSWDWGCPSFEV